MPSNNAAPQPFPFSALPRQSMSVRNKRYVSKTSMSFLGIILLLYSALGSVSPAFSKTPIAKPAVKALAAFPLEVNGRALQYAINFEPVMPEQEVTFVTPPHLTDRLAIQVDGKYLVWKQPYYRWLAPKTPGTHRVDVYLRTTAAATGYETISVSLLVMRPESQINNGFLGNYRIGQYPRALNNLSSYQAPKGFIEVTDANQHLRISPNFTLGQFLCKQKGGFPKYLVLQPRLLNKLEEFLQEVNERGIVTPNFVVMSGYRTPYYNQAIGNTANSYHIYGGAADIYIDVNNDGVMDDINYDGKQDRADAALLYQWADSLVLRRNRPDLVGGVGAYGSTPAHGPFIHIDVRGTPARWGHWPP